jgi:N-methylhydantoinase A
MGMKEVIIAPLAGVFSAYGLLCADIQRIYVHAFHAMLESSSVARANQVLHQMTAQALISARDHGYSEDAIQIQNYADLRYRRQQSELTLPLPQGDLREADLASLQEAFHKEYESTFGFRLSNSPVEIVNLRVSTTIPITKPAATTSAKKTSAVATNGKRTRKAFFGEPFGFMDTPVRAPDEVSEEGIAGPAFLDTYDSTIVVPPESHVRKAQGNLVITLS